MPVDYSKSKIYKIVCNITGETYYGSTTQPLTRRLAKHVNDIKSPSTKRYCSVKPIIERGNYDCILCEECPCENREQLHAKERTWIETNKCINKYIPNRKPNERKDTKIQYYENNKEKIMEYQKQYNEKNKEYIKQRSRAYYLKNKNKT